MPKKKVEKVYQPKVGDVISFGYCSSCSLIPCFAVVVKKSFFDTFADSYVKQCFNAHKNINTGYEPIFLLRVNNSVDDFGRQIFSPSFAFLNSSGYRVEFLYSIFRDKERMFAEKMFKAFDDVFATEPNRNVSIYHHVFASLKEIAEDVKHKKLFNGGKVHDEFIKHLVEYNSKKGGRDGQRK